MSINKVFAYLVCVCLGLVSVVCQATVTYVHTDHLGSVVAESNQSGQITRRYHYRPFGETIETQQDDVSYTGHKYDADLGLTYMQARYYDPVIGRFYANDPVGFTDISTFNRYAYVGNDPINRDDPTGKFGEATAAGCAITIETGCAPGALVGAVVDTLVWTGIIGGTIYNASKAVDSKSLADEGANSGEAAPQSPEINPGEVAGQSPEKIDRIAKDKGLIPKGPNPQAGQGSYTDPVTGKQRILVHPDADCGPHCHVNDPEGNRLDESGNKVPPESPEAHLPLRK